MDKANKRLSQGVGQDHAMADADQGIIRVLFESSFRAKMAANRVGLIKKDSEARKLTGGTM